MYVGGDNAVHAVGATPDQFATTKDAQFSPIFHTGTVHTVDGTKIKTYM